MDQALDSLVLVQIVLALLSTGILYQGFTLAKRFGMIEEKIAVLERDMRDQKDAGDEWHSLKTDVAVVHAQVAVLQNQMTTLQVSIMERLERGNHS